MRRLPISTPEALYYIKYFTESSKQDIIIDSDCTKSRPQRPHRDVLYTL